MKADVTKADIALDFEGEEFGMSPRSLSVSSLDWDASPVSLEEQIEDQEWIFPECLESSKSSWMGEMIPAAMEEGNLSEDNATEIKPSNEDEIASPSPRILPQGKKPS